MNDDINLAPIAWILEKVPKEGGSPLTKHTHPVPIGIIAKFGDSSNSPVYLTVGEPKNLEATSIEDLKSAILKAKDVVFLDFVCSSKGE